jgi:hypothetical protein
MGKIILTDAWLEIDGTDLSDRASQVAIEMPDDEVDVSSFGSGFKEWGRGLSDATITATFFQDYAANKVDAVLWPLKTSGKEFLVRVRSSSEEQSTTNPEYRMISKMYNYSPIAGSVGEASTTDVTFRNAESSGAKAGVTRHPSE